MVVNGIQKKLPTKLENNSFIFHNMYFCDNMLWKNTICDSITCKFLKKKIDVLYDEVTF